MPKKVKQFQIKNQHFKLFFIVYIYKKYIITITESCSPCCIWTPSKWWANNFSEGVFFGLSNVSLSNLHLAVSRISLGGWVRPRTLKMSFQRNSKYRNFSLNNLKKQTWKSLWIECPTTILSESIFRTSVWTCVNGIPENKLTFYKKGQK